MSFATLAVHFPAPRVCQITLQRPEAANALNTLMAQELTQAIGAPAADVRAVILTGQGEKAFCAGADLKERMGMDAAAWETQHAALRAARDAVLFCPLPVIAAVNGVAMGGGLELALACDFIYASQQARFALPEAKLGIMPGMGGTQLLPRAIGERRARELALTGEAFSAAQALEWGMVNRVFSAQLLLPEVVQVASGLAEGAPLALAGIKAAMREGAGQPIEIALGCELAQYRRVIATEDRLEGIAAFNAKRKPEFTGS